MLLFGEYFVEIVRYADAGLLQAAFRGRDMIIQIIIGHAVGIFRVDGVTDFSALGDPHFGIR